MSSLLGLLHSHSQQLERTREWVSVYGNCGNEALADLTNSSLIQNSAHRQFDIISRSRTLAVTYPTGTTLQVAVHGCNLHWFYRISINTLFPPIFSRGSWWGWWEAPEPTDNVPLYLGLVSSCISPTPTHHIFLSQFITERASTLIREFFAISLPPVWSLRGSLITRGSIKLMSLFVQFLKTYGPVSARGSAFCFLPELRADGRLLLGVTKPPSQTVQPYANFRLVQKRWNNEIFYGEFQCEIMKTNSTIFARDTCLNIISWSGQLT